MTDAERFVSALKQQTQNPAFDHCADCAEFLKATANRMMAGSQDSVKGGRVAIFVLVQTVLMDSGQYNGFEFLSERDESRRRFL